MDTLFLVALLASGILTWLLNFWKIYESLPYGIGSRVVMFRYFPYCCWWPVVLSSC